MVLDEDGEVDDEFKELARMDMESSEEARRKVDEDILEILLQCVKGELEVVARWAKMAKRSGKQAISPLPFHPHSLNLPYFYNFQIQSIYLLEPSLELLGLVSGHGSHYSLFLSKRRRMTPLLTKLARRWNSRVAPVVRSP